MPNREKNISDIRGEIAVRREAARALHARMAGASGARAAVSKLISDAAQELTRLLDIANSAEHELSECNAEMAKIKAGAAGLREQFADFRDRVPVAHIATSVSGVIVEANAAAERLFQIPRRELAGKSLASFTEPAERAAFRTRFNLCAAGRDLSEWRWTLHAADGVKVDVSISPGPVARRNNELLYWLLRQVSRSAVELPAGTSLRRTRRPRTESPADSMLKVDGPGSDSSTSFLAVMSHEIRTPLQAVVGYAEFLQSGIHGPLNEEQQNDVDRITQNIAHVQWLLGNMVEYARLGQSELELQFSDVPVDEAIQNAVATVRPFSQDKALHFDVVAARPDRLLRADRERLHQILVNLLSNSIKFSEPGGTVRVDCTDTAGEVMLLISDNGPGVPANESDRIFEPFVRLSTSRGAPGAGLGLPICRMLARRMKGDVALVREFTAGAAFVVRLPRARRAADSASRRVISRFSSDSAGPEAVAR